MLVFSLIAALAGTDPDVVVTTARPDAPGLAEAMAAAPDASVPSPTAQDATPHGLTTDQQIERWIEPARRADLNTDPFARDVGPVDDRQMHGMVEAGIGTGGYRSYGAAVSLPIGENGRLDLAYREGKNDRYGYDYGYPGYGYGYDGYGYGRRGRGFDSSSRSMSLGFSWEKDGDSRDRRRSVIPDATE